MATLTNAQTKLAKLNFSKTTIGSYDNELDNNELHDLLNDECVGFEVTEGQDVWVFGDGSFITRLEDDYYHGADVDTFEPLKAECRQKYNNELKFDWGGVKGKNLNFQDLEGE